jgi:hypothetical protein
LTTPLPPLATTVVLVLVLVRRCTTIPDLIVGVSDDDE